MTIAEKIAKRIAAEGGTEGLDVPEMVSIIEKEMEQEVAQIKAVHSLVVEICKDKMNRLSDPHLFSKDAIEYQFLGMIHDMLTEPPLDSIDVRACSSWLYGQLGIENKELRELVAKLSSYSDVWSRILDKTKRNHIPSTCNVLGDLANDAQVLLEKHKIQK